MSENLDLVRSIYAAYERGDFRTPADEFAPDFEWVQLRAVVEPGTHRGLEARDRAFRSIFEVYENFRIEPEEYIDAGDRVIVVARSHGTARGSGMQLDQRFAYVWTVRDGKPVRMEQYASRDEALKALALSA